MVSKSWLVTVAPLAVAIATTLKSVVWGLDLNETEVEIIKYCVAAFIGSGAIGAYNSTR